MWWLVVILAVAGSGGLSLVATTGTLGRGFYGLTVCTALIGLCWRVFERVLWLRFPTKAEHTVAGRNAALCVAMMGVVQAVLVVLKI
jgi:hypothetical protein